MAWWSRFGGRKRIEREQLAALLSLVTTDSKPNLNALAILAREIEPMMLNMKHFGYDLARRMADALPVPETTAARPVGLWWKPSTQSDIESDWVAHWCRELRVPVVYHRKVWELAYVLQAIHENGGMRDGARGLGFGCGVEPIASYLAAHGTAVTVTDLPPDARQSAGWAATNQHTARLDQAFHPHLVDRAAFDRLVSLRFVDMNRLPNDLADYDFCWSVCALEHVGSIAKGLAFIENSLATLRPGGISVHTTEFNIRAEGPTIDNWPTVLFQRRHFEALHARLTAAGHEVAPLDFDIGAGPMDRFIDLPPWDHDVSSDLAAWLGSSAHLKLSIDGFVSTCFGVIVRKRA